MRNFLRVMIVFMGIILGAFLGELAGSVSFLKFLSFGKEIGFQNPLVLDLGFMEVTFGVIIKLNIAAILGFAASLFVINKAI